MFKIIFGIFSALVSAPLATATLFAVSTARIDVPQPAINLPANLAPGSALPEYAACDWAEASMYDDKLVFCEARQTGGGLVRFIYDRRQKVIIRASHPVKNETIGHLINAWGTPDGYKKHGIFIEVYWGGKTAWILDPFTPHSAVKYMSYHLKLTDMPRPWRGFVSIPQS